MTSPTPDSRGDAGEPARDPVPTHPPALGRSGAPLLEVGRVVKPHGLRGEVVVELCTDRTERLEPGTTLGSDRGDLRVESSRPIQHRHLVRFAGVIDRAAAEALRGVVLRAEPLADDDALWVHELVGAAVRTPQGRQLGRIVAVEANPASDLLVLESGALVPLRFVEASRPGVDVTVDIPDGLLDLD